MVVYDPRDADPSRRFKAALLNEGFAVSADGAQWTKLDVAKIPSSDEGNFSYDPQHGLYIQTVKRGGPQGRAVAIATSSDFQTWTDHGVVFSADKLDQELGRRNIEARSQEGVLQVTVCDDKGQPIKDFEQSQEIRSDKTVVAVSWSDAKLQGLRGRNVQLRFTLQKGKLFSYWIRSE